jgi:hypothetical protein
MVITLVLRGGQWYDANKRKRIKTKMDEQRQQLIDRLQQAQNILVTVSSNPSVDQLAAAIGLTLALNKLDKHGTAVFSGQVPSTLEFLKPEETLEKNTDSLRDFIIALDKSKADKLRYKVENDVVRIFITPYRISLSEKDLDFSQGDFNVDVVVCLGVTDQKDLDTAITAHGRILHDATVACVSNVGQGSLGTINWVDPTASSLSEMMVGLSDGLDRKILDGQIATALLAGIVASTDRFRNEKTAPKTMSAAAELMAAGANQQLIASELENPTVSTPEPAQPEAATEAPAPKDQPDQLKREPGMLEIDHEASVPQPAPTAKPETAPKHPQVYVDDDGQLVSGEHTPKITGVKAGGTANETGVDVPTSDVKHEPVVETPKQADASLTANTSPEALELPAEELTLPQVNAPLLSHDENVMPPAPGPNIVQPPAQFAPAPTNWESAQPPKVPESVTDAETLIDIEKAVDSPHVHVEEAPTGDTNLNDARSAVEAALQHSAPNAPLAPVASLNAQPLGGELHNAPVSTTPTPLPTPSVLPLPNAGFNEPTPGDSPADQTLDMPLPSNPFGPGQQITPPLPPNLQTPPSAFPGAAPQQGTGGQTPPPPVPPPMLPPLQ